MTKPRAVSVKYTPALHDLYVANLKRVGFKRTAADLTGISRPTIDYWLQRGREGHEPYATLWADVVRVLGEKHVTLQAMTGAEPGGAKWLLTKMFPVEYGEKSQQSVAEALLDLLQTRLPPDVFLQVLNAISDVVGVPGVVEPEDPGGAIIDVESEAVESRRLGSGNDPD